MTHLAESLIVGAAGALMAFMSVWFWRHRDTDATFHQRADARLSAIENEIGILQTKVSPLWQSVQSQIARDLTHPHPQFKEMDELLRKLEALTISDDERVRLGLLLDERITSLDPEISDSERLSAKLLRGVMKKVLRERGDIEDFDATARV